MNFNKKQELPSLMQRFHRSQHKLTIKSQSTDQQKPTFLSRVKRFHQNNLSSPGPGAYESSFKQKHTYDFHVIRQSKFKEGIAKQHQWIVDRPRLGFTMPQSQNDHLGPGLYDKINPNYDISHSAWSKGSRFDPPKKLLGQNVGPGSYDKTQTLMPSNQKNKPLSVFMSKAPKTFFQQLIEKTKKYDKKTVYNPQQTISMHQDSYQHSKKDQVSSKKVFHLSPMFKSKCQRPSLINQYSPQTIGPGSYELETVPVENKDKVSPTVYHNRSTIKNNNVKIITTSSAKTVPPGPGSYNLETISISQNINKKNHQGIISKQERFKSKSNTQKDTFPGPGEYMRNRFTIINEEDIRVKNKGSFIRKSQKKHDFGTAARSSLRNHNQNPFGEYNVNNFDLQYKISKQRDYYQRLKLMQVTLPAFNSKLHK